jgi:cyclase
VGTGENEIVKAVLNRRKAAMSCAIAAAVVLAGLGGAVRLVQAQQIGAGQSLTVQRLRPNFYMISGAGANIGVQTGSDGLVVVDTGTQDASGRVLAEVRKMSDQPIRYVINTSADADNVGGNEAVSKAGVNVHTGASGARGEFMKAMTGGGASIMAHENVLTRMSAPTGKTSAFPSAFWPTEAFPQNRKYIYMNREGIEVLHQPAAHSDGDSLVFFRASDIVMAGNTIDANRFPVIDVEKGGSVQGEIEALNRLVELAIPPIPYIFQEGGTYVIPGHGRVYDQADVVEYRDMIVIVRDVIQDMLGRGMTLDQIKAADPVLPYEKQFGAKAGPWTTGNFIEAVYKSLAGKK